MANKPRIVMVGGGSNAWAPRILTDICLVESLSQAEFVLLDINRQAAQLVKKYMDRVAETAGIKAKFTVTTDQAAAFKNADYVIITISTGGLKAMAHDLKIPEDYGIYHTVGDTTGPGGWARLIRNFDVFVGLAKDIARYAPNAVALNYTNPMSTLTDILSRIHQGPVIGLCHGLFENLRFLRELYRLESDDQITVKYAGLNHFFWITEARAGKIDVIADLRQQLRNKSFSDLIRKVHPDAMGYASNREVATELFHLTGVMPYLGDRHTCECFPWYITSKANMKKYKIVRTSVAEREKGFRQRLKGLRQAGKKPVEKQYLERSRETAADIISAHYEQRVFIDVGNVPNSGQIANLPLGSVVETAMRVDRNGFSPITFGELPEIIQAFIEPYTHVFGMVVDACFAGDKHQALQALRLDPLCSHLNADQVNQMGRRLLNAHKKFITAF
ncbi:MAG: hypothetical protein GXY38_12810 [Planctomycetes bacterium]|nr:hypothetical protein [Planctomycetota bacterium]